MRSLYLPLLTLTFLPLSQATVSGSISASQRPSTISTCPYRTINYITHSLPQQCLTSTRKVNLTVSTTQSDGSTTVGSPFPEQPTVSSTATAQPALPANENIVESSTSLSSSPTTSSPTGQSPIPDIAPPETTEDISPLEDGKFLSFEDWKRENLKKSGQSEQIGQRGGTENVEVRKRSLVDSGSLDSLGDDAEIDLDFSGFVSDGLDTVNQPKPRPPQPASDASLSLESDRTPRVGLRSKDAGKTCKERSNYASFDCGADVIKSNPEAKSVLAILGKNKDSYMLNECSAQNKYVILELCNHIAIDTIVLANFEFFSSIFRTFKVSVSDKHPVKPDKWKSIGVFEARNSREVQAFLVENPVIWAKYVRIEFLTHYGNEYYCPVSLVRVHGTTMLEEYNHDLESLQLEEDRDSEVVSPSDSLVHDEIVSGSISGGTTSLSASSSTELVSTSEAEVNSTTAESADVPSIVTKLILSSASDVVSAIMPTFLSNSSTAKDDPTAESNLQNQTVSTHASSINSSKASSRSTTNTADDASIASTDTSANLQSATSTDTKSPTITASNNTAAVSNSHNATTQSTNSSSGTTSTINSSRGGGSATQVAPSTPTMQESFFKSVQKRLQMLESNSSLSLQYIEEQSRALRDAFRKVEQRQLAKTTSFLDHLNSTVLNELREFRLQYDQLWQSTVIELEMQRERWQQENGAINARLGVLADELIFQKRMSILQMILIMTCLGLIIFSKGNLNSYLELPLVQSVLARSPSTKWSNISNIGTPSQSPPVTRNNSARGGKRHGILKTHRRVPSEDSTIDATSQSDLYSPPTPVSLGETTDDERYHGNDGRLGDPQFDPSLIERPSTSPPELPGAETPTTPDSVLHNRNSSIDYILQSTQGGPETRPPILLVEDATPPSKHLKWRLPDE